jgi:carbon storage regulator
VLTVTRAVGERIFIGDDIVVEVRAVLDSKQVRIAIEAPRQVPIRRAEIVDAVSRANLRSLAATGDAAALAAALEPGAQRSSASSSESGSSNHSS